MHRKNVSIKFFQLAAELELIWELQSTLVLYYIILIGVNLVHLIFDRPRHMGTDHTSRTIDTQV